MAALGPLRRVLRSGMIPGALILAAIPSAALTAGSPDPVDTVLLGPPSDSLGEEVFAEQGKIAPGRGANIEGDRDLSPTPAELKWIIQRTLSAVDLQILVSEAARGTVLETDTRIRELGAELDLRDETLARLFGILGHQNVQPDRLADILAELVARHQILLERVRLLQASDPRAAELREAAAAAIETAEYDRADALLAEAEGIEFAAMGQLREAFGQDAVEAAVIYGPSGAIAGPPFKYGLAAEHGALLHRDGRADFAGPRQLVPSDRFCSRHPAHALCERWADSSPLCDRMPAHPLCEDGGFCRRHPDHKRCEQPPSPS